MKMVRRGGDILMIRPPAVHGSVGEKRKKKSWDQARR